MKPCELIEIQIRGMLKAEIPLSDILTGLSNACMHGDDIPDMIQPGQLEDFYRGLDIALDAAVAMEE